MESLALHLFSIVMELLMNLGKIVLSVELEIVKNAVRNVLKMVLLHFETVHVSVL